MRGDFSVVHTVNAGAVGVTIVSFDPLVAELCLVLAESDTSNFAAIVLVSESSKGTPSAANVEQAIVGVEVEFLANHGQLVVLELFKAFLLFDVQNDTGGIDHTGTKEPFVEVVTSWT